MAEEKETIRRLPVQTGEHAGIWRLDEEQVHGTVSLEPRRPPKVNLHPDMRATPGKFPRNRRDLTLLQGRMHSNLDVVLGDAYVEELFPGLILGSSRWAVAGLNVARVPASEWKRVELQVSGAEIIFGQPIRGVSWPTDLTIRPQQLSAELDPDVQESRAEGVEVECRFSVSWTLGDPYGFHVRSVPVITFESDEGHDVDGWVNSWVQPVIQIVSLATGRRERLMWMLVSSEGAAESNNADRVTGQVFGSGIEQERVPAERAVKASGEPVLPLFHLADAPSLADLIVLWSRLSEEHAALTLQHLATNPGLPIVARYLLLLHALESLHATVSLSPEESEDERYSARRLEVMEGLKNAPGLDPTVLKFVKKHLPRVPRRSLARRIRALLDRVPEGEGRIQKWTKATTGLESELRALGRDPKDLADRLAHARNVLSHGGVLAASVLKAGAAIAGALVKCEMLSLLGFSTSQVQAAYDRLDSTAE